VLFGLYWLAVTITTVVILSQGVPSDAWWLPHALMAVAAGTLAAWWHDAATDALGGSALSGAVVGVLNIIVQAVGYDVARWLTNTPPPAVTFDPDAAAQPWWAGMAFLAVLFLVTCLLGSILGVFGWIIAAILRPLARWLSGRGGPALPTGTP
jgi:hypothetical protein